MDMHATPGNGFAARLTAAEKMLEDHEDRIRTLEDKGTRGEVSLQNVAVDVGEIKETMRWLSRAVWGELIALIGASVLWLVTR